MTPAAARALFPITAERAYMFSGGLAPAASTVKAALDRWSDLWASDPGTLYAHYQEDWEAAREGFARVIGADPDEIAITDHTSRGSNLAVQMIDAPAGSNVVVDEFTYPSSMYPWQLPAKRHVEIRYVAARDNKIALDDIRRQVDERTIAISVSHVSPLTGFRHNLAALAEVAHARGAYLIVDAAQSAGALDLDVHRDGIDLLSCLAMKWLLGPPGVGFLYVARRHDALIPGQVGYAGLVDAFLPDAPMVFREGAFKHELGIPTLPGLRASREAVDILLGVGLKQVEAHVLELSGRCLEGLRRSDLRVYTSEVPEERAGVIALPAVQGGDALVAFLRERKVDVWGEAHLAFLRIDPHLFNNREDVDRFLAGLDEFIARHGRGAVQA